MVPRLELSELLAWLVWLSVTLAGGPVEGMPCHQGGLGSSSMRVQAVQSDRCIFAAHVQSEVLQSPLQHFEGAAVGLRTRLQLAALAYLDQVRCLQGRWRFGVCLFLAMQGQY